VSPSSQRLFFALWPDPEVRERLAALAGRLDVGGGRRTPPQSLHVTLLFLGEVDAARRSCVETVAGGVRSAPFDLALDRTGWWRRPQVLWAGATRTPEALATLAARLQQGCAACGFPPEDRPFAVHATLARRVMAAPPPRGFDPIPWSVSEFCLVESRLERGGSEYRVLRSWPLSLAGG
jgi:2'-5' RNA ligase